MTGQIGKGDRAHIVSVCCASEMKWVGTEVTVEATPTVMEHELAMCPYCGKVWERGVIVDVDLPTVGVGPIPVEWLRKKDDSDEKFLREQRRIEHIAYVTAGDDDGPAVILP